MLYALGLGAGNDPVDPDQLRLVAERDLVALPTMVVSFGWPGGFLADPAFAVDYTRVLHGAQSLVLHRPLGVSERLVARKHVEAVADKGEKTGTLVAIVDEFLDGATGEPVATSRAIAVCRGDRAAAAADPVAAPRRTPPDRPHELVFRWPTSPQQALLYRLTGDENLLHVDPDAARAAGFPRPILHGLCTYGIAALAVAALLCDWRPERLRRIEARFTAPVFPGETIEVRIWQETPGEASFRCLVTERDVVVIDNGFCEFDLG